MTPELAATPSLTAQQVAAIVERARPQQVAAGDVLFRAGDRSTRNTGRSSAGAELLDGACGVEPYRERRLAAVLDFEVRFGAAADWTVRA